MERDRFKTRTGFIIACIGSTPVGMGKYLAVSDHGIEIRWYDVSDRVYTVCDSDCVFRHDRGIRTRTLGGAGPVGAFVRTETRWGKRTIGSVIGAIPVIGAMGLAIGYTVVMGWIFKYCFMGISGQLFAMGTDMGMIGGNFDAAAPGADSLPEAVRMMLDGGIFTIGNSAWQIVGLLAALLIMAMGVSGGIEKANKIMMPLLFGLFLLLGIYIAFLPGSGEGYRYIFTLNPQGLADPEVWIFAFGQAFFSLSVAGNGSVIYGSYLDKREDLPGAARNVAIFDTIAAMLAALVILPAMGVGGVTPDTAGPGLMFVYLVNVLNGMAGGRVVGMLFFICVLFAGATSIVNLYEVPVAFLQEKLGLRRVSAVAVIGLIGAVISVLIQPWTAQWMDVVSIYICPLGALLAGLMFFWVLPKATAIEAVSEGGRKQIGAWFYPLGKYLFASAR